MNILRKYTRKSLAANRSRTLVTIIGIVLSMGLLTAVIEGANSGVQFMVRGEAARNGSWELFAYDTDGERLEGLMSDPEIREAAAWKNVGFAVAFPKSFSDPYLVIQSISDDMSELLPLNIVSGRMPQNDSEIVIPHNMPLGEHREFAEGNIIKLSVGDRVSASGEKLGICELTEGESIANAHDKNYTVVGTYMRLSNNIVSSSTPGYIAITKDADGSINGFFATLKHPSKAYSYIDSLGLPGRGPVGSGSSGANLHSDLLNVKGTVRNEGIQGVIYGFAAILIIMVSLSSIALIYNSFSISLAERTRQFGILRSIGATKKQLRGSVLYEALHLGGIGIPIGVAVGCAGIGIVLYALRDNFDSFVSAENVKMKLVISPVGLVLAAVICLVVILIAAFIPAVRAVRIAPIDAIRQTSDTKIKAKEVRTSKLTQKIFGFEGTMASKNFKRNSKRYRVTVLSLFMSVVLFISASSFCSYLTDSVEGIMSGDVDADIVLYDYGEDRLSPEAFSELISGMQGITGISYLSNAGVNTYFSPSVLSDDYWKYREGAPGGIPDDAEKEIPLYLNVQFLDDDSFRQLLKDNGIKEDDFFDASAPKALLYGKTVDFIDGKWFSYSLFRSASLPFEGKLMTLKDIEGYVFREETDNDGNPIGVYYPDEYYTEYQRTAYNGNGVVKEPDRSRGKVVPYEECFYRTELDIAAEITAISGLVGTGSAAVIYPYSMMDSVFESSEAKDASIGQIVFGIKASDSTAAAKELNDRLAEKGIRANMQNLAESRRSSRMIVTVVNVFAYGFIILISLIALANVFNTISTSIMLRRREFAMLRSIGLSQKGFSKMMNFECLIYGARSLLFGLPVAVLATFLIWKVTSQAFETGFYLPWKGVVIAVASVFIVVFATMLYATGRLRRDNTIDALKNENL